MGEPVDRRARVRRDEHPLGVAALQQSERRLVSLLVGQEHLEPVAVEADVDAGLQQPLDVVEVGAVAGVRDLDLGRIDAFLEKDLDLPRAGLARGPGWAMIGAPVRRLASAAARWTFSTFSVIPGSSAAHLMNAALIGVSWIDSSMSRTNRSAI